jgi:hypothetical protein
MLLAALTMFVEIIISAYQRITLHGNPPTDFKLID